MLGWQAILRAYGIRLGYRAVLGAEMLSMLAKYVPGRRLDAGRARRRRAPRRRRQHVGRARDDPARGRALGGRGRDRAGREPAVRLGRGRARSGRSSASPCCATALLHPRVFAPLATRLVAAHRRRRDRAAAVGRRRSACCVFYAFTWVVGGAALTALLAAVGAHPGAEAIAFLGGASAVGAIVAVVTVIFPSGLGVREGAVGAFMLALAPESAVVGAVVLNRLAITIVEALLLAAAAGLARGRPPLVSCAGMTFAVPAHERPKPRTAPDLDRLGRAGRGAHADGRGRAREARHPDRRRSARDAAARLARLLRGRQALADAVVGAEATVRVELVSVHVRPTRRRNLRIVEAARHATTRASRRRSGSTRASSRARCSPGQLLQMRATVRAGRGLELAVREHEVLAEAGEGLHTSGVVAVYDASRTLSTRVLRELVEQHLPRTDAIADPLPVGAARRAPAAAAPRCDRALHAPRTPEQTRIAGDRLAYEELLLLQVALAERRAGAPEAEPLGRPGELLERYHASLPFTLTNGPEAQRARRRPRSRARPADAPAAARRRRLGQDRRRRARDAARRRARRPGARCWRPPRCSCSSTPRPCAGSSSRSASRSR